MSKSNLVHLPRPSRGDLDTLARAKWKSSGIPEDVARKKLQQRPVDRAEATQLLGYDCPGGLLIPYFDWHGKPTEFFRVRIFDELRTGFSASAAKPQRYAQRADSLNEFYFPPLFTISWHDAWQDGDLLIVGTEGELKAAAGCHRAATENRELRVFGMGGVDVWKSGKRGIMLLAPLDRVAWSERAPDKTVLLYDADARKPTVLRAMNSFMSELVERGARPVVVALPEGGPKGLDDYLLESSIDELLAWIAEEGQQSSAALALHETNESYVYVERPGAVLDKRDSAFVKADAFTKHVYATRHHIERVPVGRDGELKDKKVPTAPAWVKWAGRHQAKRVTYLPGRSRFLVGERGETEYNLWDGLAVDPLADSAMPDVRPFARLLDHLFFHPDPEMKDEAAAARWELLCCLAYPLQHLGAKLKKAPALLGPQGVGKGLLARAVRAVWGQRNTYTLTGMALTRSFNAEMKARALIICDESTTGGRAEVTDKLKGWITEPTLEIHEKGLTPYEVPNVTNFLFLSNRGDPFFMDADDRRWFVWEIQRLLKESDPQLYEDFAEWLDERDGARQLLTYLLRLDLGDWSPHTPAMMTTAKAESIRAGQLGPGAWCIDLGERGDSVSALTGHSRLTAGRDVYTCEEVLGWYHDATNTPVGSVLANKFGNALRVPGIVKKRVNLPGGGKVTLYAVRHAKHWVTRSSAEWLAQLPPPEARKYSP